MHESNDSNQQWEKWLEHSAARFLLYARQQTRSESDAEDVLQDALVESWKRSNGCVPPDPLVYATIRRRAIDRSRQMDARVRRENKEIELLQWWEVPHVEQRSERAYLLAAVRRLPESLQEVVTLRIWGELTFREIAELLGLPLQTVSSQYKTAIAGLKTNLEKSTL